MMTPSSPVCSPYRTLIQRDPLWLSRNLAGPVYKTQGVLNISTGPSGLIRCVGEEGTGEEGTEAYRERGLPMRGPVWRENFRMFHLCFRVYEIGRGPAVQSFPSVGIQVAVLEEGQVVDVVVRNSSRD